jgi:sterol desaturase/sphingolipid hydroxylase (fatty acid hydroxylase superfamily)
MTLAQFFAVHGEAVQYGVYFGLLAALGGLEARAPRRAGPAERRRRWPANFGLTALNVVAFGALPVTGVGVALLAEARGWGFLHRWPLAPGAALLVTVLARSLVSYGVHVAMHRLPLFWRVHRVHHTDTFLDVSTTVRFHPLEFLIQVWPTVLLIAALGLPAWALVVYEILDTATNLFIHTNVRLPARLERWLRWVVVTPDLHRVHHSAAWPETDHNYGVVVPWWDRLFGTYRAAPALGPDAMTLGLAECQDARARAVGWLLLLPFRGRLEPLREPPRRIDPGARPAARRLA